MTNSISMNDYEYKYKDVKLFIQEHYKPGDYLHLNKLEQNFINIDNNVFDEILCDLYIEDVFEIYYLSVCPNCNHSAHEKYKSVVDMPEQLHCEYCGLDYNTKHFKMLLIIS